MHIRIYIGDLDPAQVLVALHENAIIPPQYQGGRYNGYIGGQQKMTLDQARRMLATTKPVIFVGEVLGRVLNVQFEDGHLLSHYDQHNGKGKTEEIITVLRETAALDSAVEDLSQEHHMDPNAVRAIVTNAPLPFSEAEKELAKVFLPTARRTSNSEIFSLGGEKLADQILEAMTRTTHEEIAQAQEVVSASGQTGVDFAARRLYAAIVKLDGEGVDLSALKGAYQNEMWLVSEAPFMLARGASKSVEGLEL